MRTFCSQGRLRVETGTRRPFLPSTENSTAVQPTFCLSGAGKWVRSSSCAKCRSLRELPLDKFSINKHHPRCKFVGVHGRRRHMSSSVEVRFFCLLQFLTQAVKIEFSLSKRHFCGSRRAAAWYRWCGTTAGGSRPDYQDSRSTLLSG